MKISRYAFRRKSSTTKSCYNVSGYIIWRSAYRGYCLRLKYIQGSINETMYLKVVYLFLKRIRWTTVHYYLPYQVPQRKINAYS